MFEICLVEKLNNEQYDNYKNFYSILKTQYSFILKRITCDFVLSNIISLKTVYINYNILIIPCFFI